jgi:hypothetical protein
MLPALYHSQDQVEPTAIVKDHVWPNLNRNSIQDTLSQNLDHFALPVINDFAPSLTLSGSTDIGSLLRSTVATSPTI